MLYNFCFVNFLPSGMVEAAQPPWPYFGPPDPALGCLTLFWAPVTLSSGSGLKLWG